MTSRSIEFGSFALDLDRVCLRGPSGQVGLRPKSFEVLRFLAEHAGRVVTKDELMKAVWRDVIVTDESLPVCISEVRRALGDKHQKIVKTVPKRGYLMDVTVSVTCALEAPSLSLPNKPSVAVLPFTNMSGDPEQEYFSDGVTEDIITALSRLRWFFVIARNSTFVFKGQAATLKEIGRELGVRYVLEGSVRRSGGRVRITAQLVDAMVGNHLWAERYDRELGDIFALQDEIAARVTTVIEPKLVAAEGTRASTRSIEDLDAWDFVARALSHFWRLSAVESAAAVAILRIAVQRHPNYAPAHSMLAFALLVSAHEGWISDATTQQRAGTLARRAAELDDNDPWVHMALGHLALAERETVEAVSRFQAALDLNPNFAVAHVYIARALVLCGQSDQSLCHFEQATRLSPRDPWNGFFFSGIAGAHYIAGRYVEAVKYARQAVQLRPGILGGHRILCASLAQGGQIKEAKSAMRTLQNLQPEISTAWIRQAVPYTTEPMEHFLAGLRKAGLT